MWFYSFAANFYFDKTFLLINVSLILIFNLLKQVSYHVHFWITTLPAVVKRSCAFSILCSTDTRLETWNDSTPRESEFTLEELREACLEDAKRQFSLETRATNSGGKA
jgi:hypothetical protein